MFILASARETDAFFLIDDKSTHQVKKKIKVVTTDSWIVSGRADWPLLHKVERKARQEERTEFS